MLIANKVTYIKYFKGEEDYTKNFDKYLLMKDGDTVSIQDINYTQKTVKKVKTEDAKIIIRTDKEITNNVNKEIKTKVNVKKEMDQKPIITENVLIKTPVKVQKIPNLNPIVESKVNSKDFVIKPTYKVTTVSTLKRVVWTDAKKRKFEANNDNIKRTKHT